MIYCYNPKQIPNTLMIVVDNDQGKPVAWEQKETVSRVFLAEDPTHTVAWNLFNISDVLDELSGNGQIHLTNEEVEILNQHLIKVGFEDQLILETTPKFVVGYVESCEAHPDSDHLSITKTRVDNDQTLQIVCGAPNITQGLKVVVAKVGAMMPDGTIIWPGALRGVKSDGMICSARELGLPNAPQKRGILELSEDTIVGSAFKF